MSAIRENEQVYIHSTELHTRYGQPIMGLGSDNKALFLRVNDQGELRVDTEVTIGSAIFDIGDVGILNIVGSNINPSTEEKQDDIIIALGSVTATMEVLDDAGISTDIGFQVGSSLPMPVIITDYNDTTRRVSVSESGRLVVTTEAPPPPPAAIEVSSSIYDDVTGTDDTMYVIPTGSNLHIEKFNAGGEQDNVSGPFVELYDDVLGTGSSMTIIDVMFVNGQSSQHDTNFTRIGDGTARILMRRKILSGSTKKIFAKWEGYVI